MSWFQPLRRPRRSEAFRSRFLDAGKDAAPLRRARQLREYVAGEVVHALLQAGFLVALIFFARTLVDLFARHGADLDPWYLRLSLFGLLVCFVLIARRLVGRVREIREARRDLAEAERQLAAMRAVGRRRQER